MPGQSVRVPDLAEDPVIVRGSDDHVAPAGPRLLDVADGVGPDEAHLRRPVEGTLHSRDRAPLAAAPAGLRSTHCCTWIGFSRSTGRTQGIERANDWR